MTAGYWIQKCIKIYWIPLVVRHAEHCIRRLRALCAAEKDLRTAEAAQEELRAEEEFLRHAVDELQKLAPEVGEEADRQPSPIDAGGCKNSYRNRPCGAGLGP